MVNRNGWSMLIIHRRLELIETCWNYQPKHHSIDVLWFVTSQSWTSDYFNPCGVYGTDVGGWLFRPRKTMMMVETPKWCNSEPLEVMGTANGSGDLCTLLRWRPGPSSGILGEAWLINACAPLLRNSQQNGQWINRMVDSALAIIIIVLIWSAWIMRN